MNKFCPNCGSKLDKDAKFCGNCGSTINVDESTNETPTPSSTVNNNSTNVNQQNNSNGLAVAGFVISLVSFFFCCGSFNWLSLILSIIGLAQSKDRNGNGKGLAIAGIVISCIVMILSIVLFATGVFARVIEEVASSM